MVKAGTARGRVYEKSLLSVPGSASSPLTLLGRSLPAKRYSPPAALPETRLARAA
jgi:hypothetical protein